MQLLDAKLYDPSVSVSKSTASLLAMTAIDTTNLRITFTIPSHGFVRVRLKSIVHGATTFPSILLGVMNGAAVVGRVAPLQSLGNTAVATAMVSVEADFVVAGLTPGSVSWDAAYGVETVIASTGLKYGGPNNTTANDAFGAFVFEVWDPKPAPTNWGVLSIDANGRVDVIKVNGTSQTARDLGANLDTTVSSRLAPTVVGRTLDVTVTGEAGIDLDNTSGSLAKGTEITGFNDLSAAQVNAEVDTALIDVRLDELLVADSDIDGVAPPTVGSVFHELLTKTSASFTYDQATDSLEALRDNLATAAALTTVQADTDDIQSRLPATLVSGRMDSSVGSMAADVVTASAIATDAIGAAEFSQAAADKVWSSATRTLTSLGASLVQEIWDRATSALTTAGSIGKLLVDNVNATISSRSSHSAADVWSVATRTLTGFGTLVSDIWSAATRTLTSFGFTANANLIQIDGQATNGNNATLNLKQLNIINNAGHALVAESTGGNGDGARFLGTGFGRGILAVGDLGAGLKIQSNVAALSIEELGAAGNSAIDVTSSSGVGISVLGAADGVNIVAGGNGHGVELQGSGTGAGLYANGGAMNGDAAQFTGAGTGKSINAPQNIAVSDGDLTLAAIANAVWTNVTRTLTSFGTLVADIWSNVTRTLTAFGFNVTVGANNDKTGYTLTAAYDPAKTASQAGDAMTLTAAERNAIADAALDRADAIEIGLTLRQALRLTAAALAGKLSGAATTTVTIRNAVADSKPRITATVDVDGNRTAITTDVS